MDTLADLTEHLRRIDGRGYKAYKAIAGRYRGNGFVLCLDHVQGDPFADPSRMRLLLSPQESGLPGWTRATPRRCVSTADFINRALHRAFMQHSAPMGSGKSGGLFLLEPGQQVLARTSVWVSAEGGVEVRFRGGLPANGRRIAGRQANELLTQNIPAAIEAAVRFAALDAEMLRQHIETVEDAQALRAQLDAAGCVAFVANGASLPRHSGIDDRPLRGKGTRAFVSPPSLKISLEAPNAGTVEGMGIPRGVTLIVGGGYHGKSTLLHAIERGVYDHIPGDGREQVVTVASAVKVRAEDGRRVAGTDISGFIGDLPDGQDTSAFVTDNASGSTSQAASIVECLEVGATCLLVDEDTSATNFMIRDARMQALIATEFEPITPFVDRVRTLYNELAVSTVVVVGGAGDYFDVADTVIAMASYEPRDVTVEARRICTEMPAERNSERRAWRPMRQRAPLRGSVDASRGRRDVSIKTHREDRVLYGHQEVDLSAVEQIVELAQTRAMAQCLAWAHANVIDGEKSIVSVLGAITAVIDAHGLDEVQPFLTGDLAEFRIFELTAFVNRVRSLECRSVPTSCCA